MGTYQAHGPQSLSIFSDGHLEGPLVYHHFDYSSNE